MNILLDTHAFLWWIDDSPRLSATARKLLGNTRNQIFLSAVSGWEIAIKVALGKLTLPKNPDRFVPEQLKKNGFLALPVELAHTLHVHRLPLHHPDPFDRLLIAQALLEHTPILTADEQFHRYKAEVLW
ncbi:MAG: type II toxin-antitoxin system VapC family toxin [Candidatus Latescibacteria bacterium]|nr:type II toxin-antitoxin system VapC family toxin [Candidatus Latescibacterota bacterium]